MVLTSTYRKTEVAPLPSLPPGWTEHRAPSGHTYYYHAETKQSTYQRPSATLTQFPPDSNNITSVAPAATNAASSDFISLNDFDESNQHIRGRASSFDAGRSGISHQHASNRRRRDNDRPKHKVSIPGCEAWILVTTRFGRRFVHNTETKESLWKFPQDVLEAVIELDRVERERRERRERGDKSQTPENEKAIRSSPSETKIQTQAVVADPEHEGSSDEYTEVEVTDSEASGDEGQEGGSTKRQRTAEAPGEQPVEFNEDDIAYQLRIMGEEHGLDPGEYGDGFGEDLEEGAEGLELTEEDSKALFRDLLDDFNISPYSTWDKVVEDGYIIQDDRYIALPNMKARKDCWDEWSRDKIATLRDNRSKQEKHDPRIAYLAFLQEHASPKLYWPEFKRKHRKEAALKDAKLAEKDKEKLFREHVKRMQLPQSTLKSDLNELLESMSIKQLNRSTSIGALPAAILTDLRYISLPPRTRDALIEIHTSTLPPPPGDDDLTAEEEARRDSQLKERRRREQALKDREFQVQQAKRKQDRDLRQGKQLLRDEERDLQEAMMIDNTGLRSQLRDAT